jgi:hypothetical protein
MRGTRRWGERKRVSPMDQCCEGGALAMTWWIIPAFDDSEWKPVVAECKWGNPLHEGKFLHRAPPMCSSNALHSSEGVE